MKKKNLLNYAHYEPSCLTGLRALIFSHLTYTPSNVMKSPITAFFNHLLRAVSARSALFKKRNAFFSAKNSKTQCHLVGCRVLNALNLEKCGVKIHNCVLLLIFFGYTSRMPLLSRISPAY